MITVGLYYPSIKHMTSTKTVASPSTVLNWGLCLGQVPIQVLCGGALSGKNKFETLEKNWQTSIMRW